MKQTFYFSNSLATITAHECPPVNGIVKAWSVKFALALGTTPASDVRTVLWQTLPPDEARRLCARLTIGARLGERFELQACKAERAFEMPHRIETLAALLVIDSPRESRTHHEEVTRDS